VEVGRERVRVDDLDVAGHAPSEPIDERDVQLQGDDSRSARREGQREGARSGADLEEHLIGLRVDDAEKTRHGRGPQEVLTQAAGHGR
jgi:hypothetical protein